ncbi:DUF3611 family protein [Merismopedia glauca]|uniref:DUF3611 domain-containing protein n=1 Tax=Merismopedia glauca CCAP 1448/3 TaxID=1296344 RepID=A0A2T1C5Z6_9CYAN|nr:DUF3611 family protein [Merismopedia glauca]PSB03705.1 hypothetical protein C7B64_07265 [Merismopedia glauca CCAP 1448/3]
MAENFESNQVPAALRQIAATMRLTGWVTFWIQLVLAVVSSLIFVFALVLSGAAGQGNAQVNNPGTGGGAFFAVCGLIALYFSVYQSFRYTRLARQLKEPDPNLRPKKADTIKLLRFGLIVSFVGMSLAVLGAEAITGTLLGKSLAQPQSLYNPAFNLRELIQPLDIFVVLANTHTIAAHFVGIGGGLWLLNRLNR